jgi:hypothetical protein
VPEHEAEKRLEHGADPDLFEPQAVVLIETVHDLERERVGVGIAGRFAVFQDPSRHVPVIAAEQREQEPEKVVGHLLRDAAHVPEVDEPDFPDGQQDKIARVRVLRGKGRARKPGAADRARCRLRSDSPARRAKAWCAGS